MAHEDGRMDWKGKAKEIEISLAQKQKELDACVLQKDNLKDELLKLRATIIRLCDEFGVAR